MLARARQYLRRRLRDPVSWLAISMIGVWSVSAFAGLAPFAMLNVICVAFAAVEWWSLASWWRARRRTPAGAVQLIPALDRWKVAVILLIALTTLVLDLWLSSVTSGNLGLGLSILGISSVVTLWYAWSRPIVVTSRGIHVGIDAVEWNQVRHVIWSEAGQVRIHFVEPNYFYGTKITLAVPPAQIAAIDALIPGTLERKGSVDRGGGPITV